MDAKTKITKAKTRLVFKFPFFGSCALGLKFIETKNVPTMATDGKYILWNTEFIDKIEEEEVAAVVAHEVLHVVFKHCLRAKKNIKKWNVATDMIINDVLKKEGFKLPEGGIFATKEEYKKWNAERIYDDLPNYLEEPKWGLFVATTSDSGKELSDAEKNQIEADLNVKIIMAHDMAKAIGKEPGGKIGELVNNIRKPQVDWRDVFHRTIGGDQPDNYTWKRCNRKVYYTQKIYMPSIEKYGVGNIVIAIDTSGSISNKEAQYFLTELNDITETYKPKSVTVIQCDSEIQSVKKYERGEVIDSIKMHGRGGTDCEPVFNYIEDENLACDNFVYLTDLEMYRFPNQAPYYPVLWVTTNKEEAPFGEITKLKMEDIK